MARGDAVRRESVENIHPLSPLQEGMFFHHLYSPRLDHYFQQFRCELDAELDTRRFRRAWQDVADRHPPLRTAFLWKERKKPLQVVYRRSSLPWREFDLSSLGAAAQERAVEHFLAADFERGFDFARAPLLRLALLRLSARRYTFVWSYHHVILDGWSIAQVLDEVLARYRELGGGPRAEVVERRPFSDVVAWIAGRDLAGSEAFWRRELAGFDTAIHLPIDRAPGEKTGRDDELRRVLGESASAEIEHFARSHGLTLATVVQGAWALLLERYSGETDIVHGTVVSGRSAGLEGIESILGMMINTQPVRSRPEPQRPAGAWLRELRDHLLEAREHEHAPLVDVQRWSEVPAGEPLFDTLVIFENFRSRIEEEAPEGGGGDDFQILQAGSVESTSYPLAVMVRPGASNLQLRLFYERGRFETVAVARLLEHFSNLLSGLARGGDGRLGEIDLLNPAERHQVLAEWNDTRGPAPPAGGFLELFAGQVAARGEAVAVSFGGPEAARVLTYGELDRRSSRLARILRRAGAGAEALVGVALEPGLDLATALLGVWKAGAAYVPVDPDYPPERVAYMLESSAAPVLVTHGSLLPRLPEFSGEIVCLDRERSNLAVGETGSIPLPEPERLAYTIYTSGSTGKPKGVQIPHGALANFLLSMARRPGLEAGDRLLSVTSLSFDIFGLELYLPLAVGGTVEWVSRTVAANGEALLKLLPGVAMLQATPSTWRLLLAVGWAGPEGLTALCGGEALPAPLGAEIAARTASAWNVYGPTETTIWSAVAAVTPRSLAEAPVVSIGRPIAETRLHVVSPTGEPQPVGVPGELLIGGAGLSRGYRSRPALTAERFVPDPFAEERGARLYRTGDLAAWLGDGRLSFSGRIDHQVKLRGFRIELGEIESRLEEHEAVAGAVVVVWGEGDAARLAAYVVAANGAEIDEAELRRHVAEALPEYMVPPVYRWLDAFPLLPNGKIDRRSLPEPVTRVGSADDDPYRNWTEEQLAAIWAEVLGVEWVGPNEHFFEIGGHSLLAVQMVGRLRQDLQVELELAEVFEAPRLRQLAERIEEVRAATGPAAAFPALEPADREGPLPLSFSQFRLWFLDQWDPGTPSLNLRRFMVIEGEFDEALFAVALNELVRRHESLRTYFVAPGGEPEQVIAEHVEPPLQVVDLRGFGASEQEAEIERLVERETHWSFRLDRPPLWRALLLRLEERRWQLVLNFHHIIIDGWSFGVLFRDLSALYEATAGRAEPLEPLPLQYADYAVWQRGWLQGERLEKQKAYWREVLGDGGSPVLELPTDRPRPPRRDHRGGHVDFHFGAELTAAINALGQRIGVTPYMILLAAFDTLIYRLTSQRDVSVGTFIAGRSRKELEKLIGFFVNIVVLRLELGGDPSFRELLLRVRKTALGAYAHQDIPIEQIYEMLGLERDPSRTLLFQVMLVLQNLPHREAEMKEVSSESAEGEALDHANFDITFWVHEMPDEFVGVIDYAIALFDQVTIERLFEHFRGLLTAAVENPGLKLAELPVLTPELAHQVTTEWNPAPVERPPGFVHELFVERAAETAGAVALRHGRRVMLYGELERETARLAGHLRARGLGPETVVGICLERSVEMVVAVLGVLRAGAAYLPLDPQLPAERLGHFLADARARAVVTDGARLELLESAASGVEPILIDGELEPAGESFKMPALDPESLAYVIYTSGSTGEPKGVAVSHRALALHTADAIVSYGVSSGYDTERDDRLLQFASLSFDACAEEIYPALASGAELVLRDDEMLGSVAEFFEALDELGITVLNVPTAYWHGFAERAAELPETVRAVIIGGEKASPESLHAWRRARCQARLYNTYGPTEATVVATRWRDEGELALGAEVPIGRPLGHVRVHVVDRELRVLPPLVHGELAIGGGALARGYGGRPALTAERFVPDPLGGSGERLYRSGDRVRWRLDGLLECTGRLDRQVKVRGYRIELGEIEAALGRHPELGEAVVLARRDGGEEETRLVAYLTPSVPTAFVPDVAELLAHLRRSLPEYMLPAAFVTLAELPRSPSGKIDRRALPAPGRERPDLGHEHVEPRTDSEVAVAEIAAELLELDRIGIYDSFFDLGGHSLLATQYRARLEELFEIELPLRAIFDTPTVADMAVTVEEIILSEIDDAEIDDVGFEDFEEIGELEEDLHELAV